MNSDLHEEFDGIERHDPNCVVLGDAMDEFTYKNMNRAFQTLMQMKSPKRLITMGKGAYEVWPMFFFPRFFRQIGNQLIDWFWFVSAEGKYYQNYGELWLDVGAYAEALRFATAVEPFVIGKPSPDYFKAALDRLGGEANETIMVGDDIESDVNAAQQIGIKGCLVRSGKYRAERDEPHATVRPFRIVDNLKQLVEQLLEQS